MTQYYGVWEGRVPGIYDNWADCQQQVHKFPSPKFRKLLAKNHKDAELEFKNGFVNNQNKGSLQVKSNSSSKKNIGSTSKNTSISSIPLNNFLTVDGAYNGQCFEYQAVWYPSKELAFAVKPCEGGTNNVAEFLGLVDAIKFLKENNLPIHIYSDSKTALSWLRSKKANTLIKNDPNQSELLQRITSAELFLNQNEELLKTAKILKWETAVWGEIPADYGRK